MIASPALRPADERDVAEAMAAFSGEEDYFASASSDADASERKSEGRIARAYSISGDEKECDSVLDKLSDLLTGLESDLARQREAGDDEAAAATEAQIEDCTRTYREFSCRFNELRDDSASDSDDDTSTEPGGGILDAGIEEGLASVAAKIDELEALLKKERAAGDGEAAGTTEYQLNYYKGHQRKLRRIQDSRHETVALRIIVLGEGDERISALPLVDLLRPVAPLVEHLLIETEPKEKLYSTLKIADAMIASRSTEPVTVEMWCDETYLGHAPDFGTVAAPGQHGRTGRGLAAESVDISVALKQVQEAVEAPSCLLAIVDPGIKHVAIPMDGAVLDARLVDIASYVVLRDDPSEGRERRELGDLLKESYCGLR